jgi:hypothetical protein
MQFIHDFPVLLMETFFDILPIAVIIFGFQFLVIRKRVKNLKKVLTGMFYVLIGITFFLVGLEEALFPIGRNMAEQLTSCNGRIITGCIFLLLLSVLVPRLRSLR